MLIYKHIDDNFQFDESQISSFKLDDLIMKIQNELNNNFYDYENDITNISIVEDPHEYVRRIILDINNIENAAMMAEMNIDFGNVNFGNENENGNEDKNISIFTSSNLRNMFAEPTPSSTTQSKFCKNSWEPSVPRSTTSRNFKMNAIDYSQVTF